MNRRLMGMVATAIAFCSMQSCSEGSASQDITGIALNDSTADESRVASATVTLARSTLEVGDTTRATAVLRDWQGRRLSRIVVWSSSNAAVATVSASGLVRAISGGTAAITATRGMKRGGATLTVTPATVPQAPVASVSISLAASALNVGQTTQAVATTRDSSNNVLTGRAVVWTSSDGSVASISVSGLVTALAGGVTSITASSEGKTGTASLSVTAAPPPPPLPVASVSVSPSTASLVVGATVQLLVTARAANDSVLTGRVVTSSSADAGIASVNSLGLVTAVSAGNTQITVTSEGKSAIATITVTAAPPPPPAPPVPVATVSVSPATSSLEVGATVQLLVTARDANDSVLTGRVVTSSSADAGIASVNALGLVTAVSPGNTQITVTSEGKSAIATITVTAVPPPPPPPPAPVASVSVSPATSSLIVGATVQLVVTAFDANNNVLTGRVVTSSSANAGIASVNSLGLVTAVSPGNTQITVTSEGKSASATITVSAPPPVPVASVTVSPSSSSILIGGTVQLAAVTRDASGNLLTGRAISWSSANSAVATVSSTGSVTAMGAGTTAITATSGSASGTASITASVPPPPPPPPVGTLEPRPGAGSTILFQDDFERYDGTCQSLVTVGRWATSDDNCNTGSSVITTPDGTGSLGTATGIGGHSARWNWPVSTSEQFYIIDRGVSGFSGRQPEYFSYDYRAPNFVYVGAYPRLGKKMFLMLIGGGQTGRVTINPWEWGLQQSNGVHLNPTFDQWPAGLTSQAAYAAYLTNGQWHRYTIMRLPESSNGAMDGMIRIWVDGYLVVNWTQVGTFTGNTSAIDLAGTFNGGSSKAQTEYYDNVIVWR